jgi:hypothetical protein
MISLILVILNIAFAVNIAMTIMYRERWKRAEAHIVMLMNTIRRFAEADMARLDKLS